MFPTWFEVESTPMPEQVFSQASVLMPPIASSSGPADRLEGVFSAHIELYGDFDLLWPVALAYLG